LSTKPSVSIRQQVLMILTSKWLSINTGSVKYILVRSQKLSHEEQSQIIKDHGTDSSERNWDQPPEYSQIVTR